MSSPQGPIQPFDTFTIQNIEISDLRSALGDGVRDFFRKPLLSLLFGVIFALFGLAFITGLLPG